MNTFVKLCNEIITAGEFNATMPLNMKDWYCDTACCACGDVAMYRARNENEILRSDAESLKIKASAFSRELDQAEILLYHMNKPRVGRSIYQSDCNGRWMYAFNSGMFTDQEQRHPHLTTNHNSREILHDYIRLVISKVEDINV